MLTPREPDEGAVRRLDNNNAEFQTGTLVFTVAGQAANTVTFLDVSLKVEDGGTWKGDDVTRQRIGFRAAAIQ